jgi:hypothetical protein
VAGQIEEDVDIIATDLFGKFCKQRRKTVALIGTIVTVENNESGSWAYLSHGGVSEPSESTFGETPPNDFLMAYVGAFTYVPQSLGTAWLGQSRKSFDRWN